ncbi:hypothetical protein IEC97_11240 [Neobacillus cucumis]|uniref:hypothetical protein n=1 Tax=Neobacillus cucumis TaxID=1740721 RepID=UPI0018DF31E8|nr:hypothetical protein [Neobacillus cucumis]MBI0577932.1 hypothetical protein [Neobacillus cucumis]
MGKRLFISGIIAVIFSVVIRSILRSNGIHNFLSESATGQALIFLVIYLLLSLILKRRSER